jgi:hypothetical protein
VGHGAAPLREKPAAAAAAAAGVPSLAISTGPTLMKTTGRPVPDARGKHAGPWTQQEHEAFLVGLSIYGRKWKKVALSVRSRTPAQIRLHARWYFAKLEKTQGGSSDGMEGGGSSGGEEHVAASDGGTQGGSSDGMEGGGSSGGEEHVAASDGGSSSDKTFSNSANDAAVTEWARQAGGLARKVNFYLCRSNITDAAMTALAANCANLTTINLRGCRNLTDTAITVLTKNCTHLTTINLGDCGNLTDAAIAALAANCANLTTINLGGCGNITNAAMTALWASLAVNKARYDARDQKRAKVQHITTKQRRNCERRAALDAILAWGAASLTRGCEEHYIDPADVGAELAALRTIERGDAHASGGSALATVFAPMAPVNWADELSDAAAAGWITTEQEVWWLQARAGVEVEFPQALDLLDARMSATTAAGSYICGGGSSIAGAAKTR